jgi:hypothetical protein
VEKANQGAISLRELSLTLMALRGRRGITLEKIAGAEHLLGLPAVQFEATSTSESPESAAYGLLTCLLSEAAGMVKKHPRELIYTELNFEQTPTTYTDRKSEVINRLGLQALDYDGYSRVSYEQLALALVRIDRSPCLHGPNTVLYNDARRLHLEYATKMLKEAFLQIHELEGKGASREIAERILESLPNARRTLQELGLGDQSAESFALDAVRTFPSKIWAREFSTWLPVFNRVNPNPRGLGDGWALQLLFSFDSSDDDFDEAPDDWEVELLAVIARSLEERDAWHGVLFEDGIRGRFFSEAPIS